ncbi:hypothetical protein PIROE2DRAFT_65035 [Piromyces sp. E2]|nr:hypothetical protein PIROE2DRAFT_65035 [Piromyces sp. E2]|eukprot:OUM57394.1 hypothetical protein PIROE2DRAFT_65035 [Piromyces sp. E2]
MKNIEISDITTAINKKEHLNSNLFLLHGDGEGQNEGNGNEFLMEPISTTVYSNKKEQRRNKIEVIGGSQEFSDNINRENQENQENSSSINIISESNTEISKVIPTSPGSVDSNNSEKVHTSLGQSIILLLNANNKALVNSIDLYKKIPLTSALQNIDKYIRNDNKGTAMKIIYNPLKDMIIKKKSNSNNSFKIINWLYFNSGTKRPLKQLLQEEIRSENKKSKLIAIQIYKNIIDEQSHILKKKEEIADVISKLWININPYLSTKYIKNPVEKSRKVVEKIIDEENEDFGHFGILLKLSLILGHQNKKNFIAIFKLDATKEKFLQIVSSNILNNEFVGGRNLGFYMLRKFLLIDGPEKFKPMVDQLLIMLDQNDNSSKSVERMNSLFIIYEIFQLNQDILKSSSHTRLRSVLTEQLLLRIKDEDIKLRNEAMLLFCYLDQNEIIPKLSNKLIDSDEKVRAASEAALLNTLLKHKSHMDVIFTFIEYIRSIPGEEEDKKVLIKEIDTPSIIEVVDDTDTNNKDSHDTLNKNNVWNSEQILYALLQLLNPLHLTSSTVPREALGKNLPDSFQTVILDTLYEIQKQSQPLIFEILSISIANILTTTIRHYSKEIDANPISPTSTSNTQSSPPSTTASLLSEEDRRKNVHSLYKFTIQYLFYPLLDTVQEGIQYHSPKDSNDGDLSSLQEQLYNTLTCACLQIHILKYIYMLQSL